MRWIVTKAKPSNMESTHPVPFNLILLFLKNCHVLALQTSLAARRPLPELSQSQQLPPQGVTMAVWFVNRDFFLVGQRMICGIETVHVTMLACMLAAMCKQARSCVHETSRCSATDVQGEQVTNMHVQHETKHTRTT